MHYISRRAFLKISSLSLGGLIIIGCDDLTNEPKYTVEILEDNFFAPASLIVAKGTKVAWKNKATIAHTVTCDPAQATDDVSVLLPAASEAWDSGRIYPGEIWTYTFDVPGNYVYFSRYADSSQMIGSVRVEGSAGINHLFGG